MADLKNLADSLNVKINFEKPTGKKRRSWLMEDSNKTDQKISVYKPDNKTGSINPVYEQDLNRSMDPIDQPNSLNRVYKPLNLSLKNIRGNPMKIAQYFFELSRDQLHHYTPKITRSKITNDLNISINSLKTALKFLLKNCLIERVCSISGKAGYSQYKLKDSLFEEIKIFYKTGSINRIYSSGSLDIRNTTTTMLDPFSRIEINPDPLVHIGLTDNHIEQLLKQCNLTPEHIQESIHHFAFDLAHNDKIKAINKNPLDYFMGILRKGNYYTAPSNYESQESRNKRLYLEDKLKREEANRALEEKIKSLEWDDWASKLPEMELMEFYIEDQPLHNVPERSQQTLRRRSALINAKQHFESVVWPERKKAIAAEYETREQTSS